MVTRAERSASWIDAAINPALVPETYAEDRRGQRVLEIREILWGHTLHGVTQYRKPRQILFGESKGCAHFLPADRLTRDPFPLIRADGQGLVLGLTYGMQGYLERRGRRIPLAELRQGELGMPSMLLSTAEQPAFDVPLEPDDQVLLSLGPVTVLLRQVAWTRPVSTSIVKAINWGFAAILLCCLASSSRGSSTASWWCAIRWCLPPRAEHLDSLIFPT